MLVFTDFQGSQTTVEVPGDAVSETISLVYTYLEEPSHPSAWHFANHAFTLEVFKGGQLQPDYAFARPLRVTIEYTDADLGGFAEESLTLRTWDGAAWSSDGINLLERNLAGNELIVSLEHLSEFALLTIDHWEVQLPVLFKAYRPPVSPECREQIGNGGFETEASWAVGQTRRPARLTKDRAHTGARSALLGIQSGETDLLSYSSVRQTVTIPTGLESATLTFWTYFLPGQDSGDRREVLLLDANDRLLKILLRATSGAASWTKHTHDLSAYAGQTVKLYLNAYNDGDGQAVAGFYVDDASLQTCTVPDPPAPPPMPVPPAPPECYPFLLTSKAVGAAPHGVGVNSSARRVYVANHDADSLSVLDAVSHNLLATVPVGDGPNGVAYNSANDRIYVANRNSNSVSVLRASDYALVKTVAVGQTPDGVAVNPITNRIYVANFGDNTVSIIDGATNAVISTPPAGLEPSMVAVNTVTNKAYVSLHKENKVAVIDGAGGVSKVSVGAKGGYGIAVDELRNLVYVATIETARLAVIDGQQGVLLGWAEIRRTPGGQLVPLRMVAVNPYVGATGHLYVTSAGSDGGWNKLLLFSKGWEDGFGTPQTFDLDQPREGIALDPATLRVWVPSRSTNQVAIYQDGEPICRPPSTLAAAEEISLQLCAVGAEETCLEGADR
jgi:YVTN family beta-propeller protein